MVINHSLRLEIYKIIYLKPTIKYVPNRLNKKADIRHPQNSDKPIWGIGTVSDTVRKSLVGWFNYLNQPFNFLTN